MSTALSSSPGYDAGLRIDVSIWMQTVGTTLFTSELSSTLRLRMVARERRGTHGLLYPAAVWNDA